MKRNLFFAVTFLAVLVGGVFCSPKAHATDWVGNEVTAGTYYLYNVGAKQFLGFGQNWGTRATVDHAGIPVTLSGSGTYKIVTNVASSGNGLKDGGYMDGAAGDQIAWTFTDAGVAGKNVFYIHNGEKYFYYDSGASESSVCSTGANPGNANAQWQLVTAAQRDAAFAAAQASESEPLDITYKYIENPNTTYFTNMYSTTNPWTTGATNAWDIKGGNKDWWDGKDNTGEVWNKTFDNYIEITDIPNGVYEFGVMGFYRDGDGATAIAHHHAGTFVGNAKIYANTDEVALQSIGVSNQTSEIYAGNDVSAAVSETTYYVPNSQLGASLYFFRGKYPWQTVRTTVTNGTLKFGVKKTTGISNDWTIVDKFYLSYVKPVISTVAVALPGGAMETDTWYYFDIPVDGDYDLTLTTLADIVYTTDGAILLENAGDVDANFAKVDELPLTAGRYYVKSTSAQTLAVAAHSFTYTVGDATPSVADNGYTQSTTITLTYADAATNDPDGEFQILDASKITVDGAAATASVSGKVLTITLTGAVTAGASYAVSVAAGAVGYNAENANTATSLTLNTPVVLDGVYCLYDAAEYVFLARGCAWGTEAAADKYGIPFNLVTDATGASSIEFVDNTGAYLYSTSVGNAAGMFTDNASTGWTFVPTAGGYYLKDANGDVYAKVDNGDYGYYVHTVAGTASATVWTLKTKDERDAIIAAYPTDNINNVIAASGISTTAGEFTTELSNNYNSEDLTSQIGTATFAGTVGSWTWSQVRGQDKQPAYGTGFCELWNATGTHSQTIDKANLPEGIYKVTVQGYERRCANDAATALKAAGYNLVSTFLAANGEQVRFTDWNDVDGKPTNTGAAVTAFTAGEATNEVYIYLDGNTDLTLTVKKPNYIWDNWAIFNNFTLTRYYQTEATMAVDAEAKYGTFVAPFDVTIPGGVSAYKVTGVESDGSTLTLTKVTTTIPANTPVVLNAESGLAATTFKGKAVVGTPTEGLLTGVYADTPALNGSYVLQNNGGKVGFYQVDTDVATPTVGANHAYLAMGGGSAKAFFFDDEATAIAGVEAAAEDNAPAYNLAGQPVTKDFKGIVIKNGKKFLQK